ncbi:MAG: glutamine-hydrolyzing carbamoyl-phosphate synthase small subunit [bacterium]
MKKAILALADGTVYEGLSLGAEGTVVGEVVFNTSMFGYQEILTDPSYKDQLVNMTFPLIGIYGANSEDVESGRVQAAGFIVKEASRTASNWRSETGFEDYLVQAGVVGIQGIDSRSLTRHLRDNGSQMGLISTEVSDPAALIARAAEAEPMAGKDLVCRVSCREPYDWEGGFWTLKNGYTRSDTFIQPKPVKKVAVYDFGVKSNILRNLWELGCSLKIFPARTPAREIMEYDPDGVFLSNGPGDPAAVTYAIENVKSLIGKKPIFGICLGHQILCLALGLDTYKLKFGHRGGNHPVKDLKSGKVEITSQNHGFAVGRERLNDHPEIELSHLNLNDNTVEGIRHRWHPLFSLQYHPESSPGPHDSAYLFGRFIDLMNQ